VIHKKLTSRKIGNSLHPCGGLEFSKKLIRFLS
jgi:hypothetical protein